VWSIWNNGGRFHIVRETAFECIRNNTFKCQLFQLIYPIIADCRVGTSDDPHRYSEERMSEVWDSLVKSPLLYRTGETVKRTRLFFSRGAVRILCAVVGRFLVVFNDHGD
jgi:hypothetical protein